MKVSKLKERLSTMEDDDDIFVLLFNKERFDFDPDEDELCLTPEKWAMLVAELEEMPFASLWEDINDAVGEYAEVNPNFKEESL